MAPEAERAGAEPVPDEDVRLALLADLLDPEELDLLRPAPAAFVPPMLASLTERYFSDPDWLYERKLDGMRIVAVRDARGTRLYSRTQRENTATYPEVVDALTASTPPGLLADGEIVAFDGAQTSFSALQGRLGISDARRARASGVAVFYYLFDLMGYAGFDLTRLPLRTRKRILRAAVTFEDPLRFSSHRNTEGEAYLEQACARGWEGLIAKRADARYEPGIRSPSWLKFKCVREQELVIGGFTESAASARAGFGALLLGYYDGDALHYAGKVGTGFDQKTLRALRARLDGLARTDCPFTDPPRRSTAHWVAPELVAQIGFTEWTRDGRLRHPRYRGLREDKPARDVTREAPPA